MKEYLDLLRHVYTNGQDRPDRTGVGTRGVFGAQMRIDLAKGFPLLTTKRIHFKSVAYELLWFLRGDTNVKFLKDHGVSIWNEWADENGDLGPVYGKQWRRWEKPDVGEIDQISRLIANLITDPFSRRHIVSAWNPADVPKMKLPPCHTLWQCYVDVPQGQWKRLNLSLYARSIDIFIGLPFNIASYALLLTILADITEMTPGELVISFGDLHLYQNHFAQAEEQLLRDPRPLPKLDASANGKSINDVCYSDFILSCYNPHTAIKAPIAV